MRIILDVTPPVPNKLLEKSLRLLLRTTSLSVQYVRRGQSKGDLLEPIPRFAEAKAVGDLFIRTDVGRRRAHP